MTRKSRPFWNRLTQAMKAQAVKTDAPQRLQPASAVRPLALEQRFMFDGAAAVDVAHAATDAAAAEHAVDAASALRHALTAEAQRATEGSPGAPQRQEVVFVDNRVQDYQQLISGLKPGTEVVLLDSSKDGLQQIANYLDGRSGIDAVHVVSHGDTGKVQLGNLWLDNQNLASHSQALASLGKALSADGDILLYGCEIGADGAGQDFIESLAKSTGADVAASTNLTGAQGRGGDWVLETSTGSIEAALPFALADVSAYDGVLGDPVSGTTDFGSGGNDNEIVSGPGNLGVTAQNIRGSGWDVTVTTTTNTRISIQAGDLAWETGDGIYYIDNDSDGEPLQSFKVASNSGSIFDLKNVDVTLSSPSTTDSGLTTLAVTGYRNGVAVSGASQLFDINITGGQSNLEAINLSGNSNFVGVDSFVITRSSGLDVVYLGIDNINVANVRAPTLAPSMSATGVNPTFTENGAAVTLFSGVAANTNDSGQTFTGAQFTVSNVAGSTEYLTIHGVNVALSNGNSVSLGSGYVNVSVSGGLATIALSGATLSNTDMSSLLSGMTYSNSSDNPGSATRVVTLTRLTDSGSSNNTVTTSISSAVTVVPVNDAPTNITLSNTVLSQSQGSNATVATLSTTDVDSTSFTYSLMSGSGSTDNALFTLSGSTLKAVNASTMSAGTYPILLRTTDDGGATYDKAVTIVVTDDIAPAFDQTPTVSNPTTGGFTLSGSVTEAGNVHYVVVPDGASAPSVAQVIAGHNASGTMAEASGSQVLNSAPYDFSLTLTGLAASTMYDVYVVSRDSAGNSTVSVVKVDATIAVGNPPVVSTPIPAQSIAQNGGLNFSVPVGTFTDPDGDSLTLSALLADGSALPAWLSFNAATGTFSGTPGNADVGSLSIKVTATDTTSNSVSTTFSLTVTNVNDAPVVSVTIPPLVVLQDGFLNFTVPAGTFSDPDGDTLILSATLADGSALPAWLTFNTATRTFSGTPGSNDIGSLSIKLTATDPDNATVSTNFALIVTNVNDAPVVGAPVPPQSIPQDGSLNFTLPAGTFSDPDGDTLILSATLADGSALPAWLTFNTATRTFSGTPGNADVGSLSIKLTATDPSNASVSTTFSLTVTSVNVAPVTVSMVLDQTSLNAQQTAVLTVRFSEAVTGLDVADFTVVDGVLSGLSSADGGLTWTATLTPAAGKVHSALQVILNNAGYTDLAGNAGSNTSVSGSYAINTVLPAQPVLQVQRNAEGSATVLVDALEVGAAWAYSLDGGQSWQAGQGSVVTLASPGLYHVQVRQTNAVGNVSQEGALSVSVAPQAVPPRVEWPVMGIFSGAGADAGAGIWEAAVAPVGLAPLGLDADAMVLPRGSGHVFVGSGYATPGGSSFFGGGVATDSSELSSGFLGGYSGVIGASAFAGVAPQEAMADRLVLLQPVDAVVAAADRQVDWKIPPTMFGHSDPLASVQFSMTLANGQPLPAWLKFDARTGQVSGVMPAGFQGELTLRLTARDSQGSAVSTVIKLKATDGGTAARAGVAEQLQRQAQLRAGHMAAQRLHL